MNVAIDFLSTIQDKWYTWISKNTFEALITSRVSLQRTNLIYVKGGFGTNYCVSRITRNDRS